MEIIILLIFTFAAIILTIHVVIKSNTTEQQMNDLITKAEQHYNISEGSKDEENHG